jgi:cyclophilin family peptidyl-prolyl cis-trans isomerase
VNGKPQWDAPPAMQTAPSRRYRAVLDTTKGRIVIDLDPAAAPITVNNFVFLTRCGFYNGITFHRIAKNFVIQGGDPSGTGTGGPGYTFPDELPSRRGYPIGAVAMANSGPDTNGSQFFIVTGAAAAQLPGNYSLFGRVVEGQAVAKAIEDLPVQGGGSDGAPAETVTITSATIEEG